MVGLISTVFESTQRDNINSDLEKAIVLAEKLDFLDIQLLRKFYMNGKEYPFNHQPYCFPLLFSEMKVSHKIKIGMEALRKRLNNMVDLGLLEKIKHSNPANYGPIVDKSLFIRAVITKFFVINGLTKFL
ncbi:MAG: hypothetical protein HYS62_00825 [Candidatus Aenigmarchaeota archaeon]|nr:hypothetical protein [Candidatus Aenigmarchaeota archaeon]